MILSTVAGTAASSTASSLAGRVSVTCVTRVGVLRHMLSDGAIYAAILRELGFKCRKGFEIHFHMNSS